MRAAPNRELWLALLGCGLLALIQWFPAFRSIAATGFGDWQMIHHNWEAAYVSLARFGEWPLWDPFHCGGVSILRNPESQVYSPLFLLSFATGTVIAIKLMLWGHIACALCGMYWLARTRYRLGAIASAFSAAAWGCTGCFAWIGAGGHATFLPFAFTPWLVYLVHRQKQPQRELAWLVLLLVVTLCEGGTYPLPYFALMLAVECALRWLDSAKRDARGQLRAALDTARFGLAVALLTGLTGAIRFVPEYLSLREFPRQMPNNDSVTLAEVVTMLTARDHSWRVAGHPFVWAEYGSYVGWPTLLLGAIGAYLVMRRAGQRHLLFGLLFYGLFMLGNVGEYSAWSLLHHLPVYDSLRVPTRFAMLFTFYLALLAGHALERIERLVPKRRVAQLALGLFALANLGDMLSVTLPIIDRWHEQALDRSTPAESFYLVGGDYYHRYASYPWLNLGTPTCYAGGMNWVVSNALWLGPRPQLRVLANAGQVLSWGRTPQHVWAEIDATSVARVVINQNYASGWISNVSTPENDHGRLALTLPAGRQRIELSYRPPEFVTCALLSGSGLLCLLGLLFAGDFAARSRLSERSKQILDGPAQPG
jgi:hypothetical protein